MGKRRRRNIALRCKCIKLFNLRKCSNDAIIRLQTIEWDEMQFDIPVLGLLDDRLVSDNFNCSGLRIGTHLYPLK